MGKIIKKKVKRVPESEKCDVADSHISKPEVATNNKRKLEDQYSEQDEEVATNSQLSEVEPDEENTEEFDPEKEAAELDEPMPEWEDDNDGKDEIKEENYQKEFKILGQQTFRDLKKIHVTSSWVNTATVFPAELSEDNLCNLDEVTGLPNELAVRVKDTIQHWFPVQKTVIPMLLNSILRPPALRPRDVTISAPTGSGKTLCYVIPILAAIGSTRNDRLSAIIVVPVQTLAQQIKEEMSKFNACNAKVAVLSGATEFEKEFSAIHNKEFTKCVANIIIATPARLMEHLTDARSKIKLDTLRFLIVDEADRMGTKVRSEWLDVVERRSGGTSRAGNIFDTIESRNAPRKILLSATISKDVEELHMWNLHKPCLFRATVTKSQEVHLDGIDHVSGGALALPSSIKHRFLEAEQTVHPLVIHKIIYDNDFKKVIIFTEEKVSSSRLAHVLCSLSKKEYNVEHLTGDLFGKRRSKVLQRFKNGNTRILICSDVLSRGVDVADIDCVVNYDLPQNDRLFVHRAGRTARAGKSGSLISIGDKEQKRRFMRMLKATNLLDGVIEIEISQDDMEPMMENYEKALANLQQVVTGKEKVNKKNVSGFAHRPKKRWTRRANEENSTGENPNYIKIGC